MCKYLAVLSWIAILCALGGLAQIGFAFFAFGRQRATQENIEQAAVGLTDSVKAKFSSGQVGEGDQEDASSDLAGAADYVRSLADLAAKLGGLTPPVAALLISTILFFFAATLAAIAELHG
jgi:hypothetical protein